MQSQEAALSIINSCLAGVGPLDPTTLAALALMLFFLNIAIPAIVKDYVVRAWRRWVHPDEFQRAKREIELARAAVADEKAEFAAARTCVERLIVEHDRMAAEVIRLRMHLATNSLIRDGADNRDTDSQSACRDAA